MPAGSFFTQILNLDEATVKFEIWDTAGQEKYQSVCHLYYRDADAALLVYDIANKVRPLAGPCHHPGVISAAMHPIQG